MMHVKAVIKFPSGLEVVCEGGIKDGKTNPFTKLEWQEHIRKLQGKGYEVSLLRFVEA